jgi:hypothetical protein
VEGKFAAGDRATIHGITLHGVPTWEVRHKATSDSIRCDDLVANGTADTFEAAKAAALFEASTQSPEMKISPH